MTTFVTYTIALLAASALFWHCQILKKSGAVARDPISLLGLVVIVSIGLLRETRAIPESQAVQLGLILLMVVLAFQLVIRSIRKRLMHKMFLSAYLPAVVSALLFIINAVMNPDLSLSLLLGRSLGVISLAVTGLILSLSSLTLRDLAGVIVVSVSFVYTIAPLTGDNWRSCDKFKCGPFGAMYIGPFSSENTVSMLCGVGILCGLIGYYSTRNFAAFGLFALALYATESRTSQLAIAVALTAWPLAAACARFMHRNTDTLHPTPGQWRLIVAVFSTGVAGLFWEGFKLLLEAQPADFSNRGTVWILGLAALGKDWLTGLGLDRWYIFQSVGAVPAHFPHSEYLFLLFTGGAGAVVGLFWIFVQSMRSASAHKGTFAFAVSYVVYLAVVGMTELYWNPIALDGNALIILPLIFILARKVVSDLPNRQDLRPSNSPRLPTIRRPYELRRPSGRF
ncbi:hypothetical protein E5206_06115 [Arthrobacter sp. PAMC25564]|uniref:O-antigen ligase family protein n=1 Tax=Arthrobacter sp. PAMC25564 TaxID=2565366 RepID=UPI0010A2212B|nr:hypothetical protein [Arthrobacter sp. PAMC25564]QCB96553.1 hypothetical protein E5206_06115 [Arthrobacter sp. PAMC25564]